MTDKKNLIYRLRQISYELFSCSDELCDLYGREYEDYHTLRSTGLKTQNISHKLEKEVNDDIVAQN